MVYFALVQLNSRSIDFIWHVISSHIVLNDFQLACQALQLIHWSRDAFWLMVCCCPRIIHLLYRLYSACILHYTPIIQAIHCLYTAFTNSAWRPSPIIQSSTLKPGDHRWSGESSMRNTSLWRTLSSRCDYVLYPMHLCYYIQAHNFEVLWSSR